MVFSSLIFLLAFLPLNLILYFTTKSVRLRNAILLVFSLVFYAWGEPVYVLILLGMSFFSWVFSLGVEKAGDNKGLRRFWLTLAVIVCVGAIGFFKYAGFLATNLNALFGKALLPVPHVALPIGISFYTFQLLTYVVDVYRGAAPAQRRYRDVLLYAALFHQCIAGPIVRYQSIGAELFGGAAPDADWAGGISRFCGGLAKKVLFANPCGALADLLLAPNPANAAAAASAAQTLGRQSVLGLWLGVIAYGLQIYLDFSAYSDMAIGMGRMLGLHYPENFNYPYISRSVKEFWRRWHMTLGSFFRDYVYIPLGGSRCGVPRWILNTFVVWALTGLWHGASWNFVLWGLWFFVLQLLERAFLGKILDKVPVLSNLYLLLAVLSGWVLFRYSDLHLVLTALRGMFGFAGNALTDFTALTLAKNKLFLLLASAVICTPLPKRIGARLDRGGSGLWRTLRYAVLPVICLLLSTAALVGDSYNPFIYFQF